MKKLLLATCLLALPLLSHGESVALTQTSLSRYVEGENKLRACFFSPDGRYFVGMRDQYKTGVPPIFVLDLHSAKSYDIDHSSGWHITFSPSSRYMVLSESGDNKASHYPQTILVELPTGAVHKIAPDVAMQAFFSPDERYIAFSYEREQKIQLYDLRAKRSLKEHKLGEFGGYDDILWSSQGNIVAVEKGRLVFLQVPSLKQSGEIKWQSDSSPRLLRYTPDGKYLIVGLSANTPEASSSLFYINAETTKYKKLLETCPQSLGISADSKTLHYDDGKNNYSYTIATGDSSQQTWAGKLKSCFYSPDGQHQLAERGDQNILTHDRSYGHKVDPQLGIKAHLREVVYSPYGRSLYFTTYGNECYIYNYDFNSRKLSAPLKSSTQSRYTFTPDNKSLIEISPEGLRVHPIP